MLWHTKVKAPAKEERKVDTKNNKIVFRLNSFKDLARWIDKNFTPPVAFFLKGWLWGLEEAYINAKIQTAVDKSIEPHKPSDPTLSEPTYHSYPSEVKGLDSIGFSYKQKN